MDAGAPLPISVVVIGRNEGSRLQRCILALPKGTLVVYVDSGSTDGSVEWARETGVEVVALDLTIPFTAARARNAGFERARQLAPETHYVQFLDGDCELDTMWLTEGTQFLDVHPTVAAVTGHLKERHPERSVYNWLCQKEWAGPVGEIRYCAGNVMMRAAALDSAGGYRNDVIAAEEDELSIRLRKLGWRIWRLDAPMAIHDADMTRFSQWWKRNVRAGYAFALGAAIHGRAPERHFVWESRRALLWGFFLPLLILVLGGLFPAAFSLFAAYPVQVMRQAFRNRGTTQERIVLAFFQVLSRFPEAIGQIRYWWDRSHKLQPRIIEHKISAGR